MEHLKKLKTKKLWKNNFFWIISLLIITVAWVPPNSNEIKVRLKRLLHNSEMKGYIVVGIEPDPCSKDVGISLEDMRYLFSKASFMNATEIGGEISYPNGSGKTETEQPEMYAKAIERIIGLTLGKRIDDKEKEVWAISKQQLTEAYPHKTFPITLNGEEGSAIDYSELFFEILLTAQSNYQAIQILKEEIQILKEMIRQQQAQIDGENERPDKNTLKIYPNPANGQVIFEYEIQQNFQKADIFIHNSQGKMMDYIELNTSGKNTIQNNIDYSKGLYICTLIVDGKSTATTKMTVQ